MVSCVIRSTVLVAALTVAVEQTTAVSQPLNTSLATLPVGYYGAMWARGTENIAMLARQRLVILMQEDGVCWTRCCPDRQNNTYAGVCQAASIQPPPDATKNPGCDPACDQHATQNGVFTKVKAAAVAMGLPKPHAMLYMNGVYDWPFDAAHGGGATSVDVCDIHGVPHAEESDPGIYPSFLLDYGREAGRQAFLNAVQRYVVDGVSDGVFLDNFAEVPMSCHPRGSDNCTVLRNQWASKFNKPSVITADQVAAYTEGKNQSLTRAGAMINTAGGAFAAFTIGVQPNPNGGNMAVIKLGAPFGNATSVIAVTKTVFANGYKYFLLLPRAFSSPNRPPPATVSMCSDFEIATFLLALEEGMFIGCNGWSDDFEKRLGNPTGPAVTTNGVMRRTFESGTSVMWTVGTQNVNITWAN
eukprot:m.48910 g.48910  ORF g.48910 m.48910 type:complete len:414 (-) comp20888_c0_seq1:86-1327(-)